MMGAISLHRGMSIKSYAKRNSSSCEIRDFILNAPTDLAHDWERDGKMGFVDSVKNDYIIVRGRET
jgi:hypothetical protein